MVLEFSNIGYPGKISAIFNIDIDIIWSSTISDISNPTQYFVYIGCHLNVGASYLCIALGLCKWTILHQNISIGAT